MESSGVDPSQLKGKLLGASPLRGQTLEFNADRFFNATSDKMKFETLKNNENLWRDIRNDLKAWLETRLPVWLEEEPPWLTDYHRSLIPEWAVDNKALLSRIRNKNVEVILENRRRSSAANLLGALPKPKNVEMIPENRSRSSAARLPGALPNPQTK